MKNAKGIPALKAVSQNLMHSNLSITDGVYGILSEIDIKKQIQTLGEEFRQTSEGKSDFIILQIEQLLNGLKAKGV